MTPHSVRPSLTHPLPGTPSAASLALTRRAGGAATVLLHRRGPRTAGIGPATGGSGPAVGTSTAPARVAPVLTCRPQLLTPPGTERARGEVEQWLARGELDPETYRDLRRVISAVEAATHG